MRMENAEDEGFHSRKQQIDFCTMGMFIIDEIHFPYPTPPVFNVLGGGGTFAAIGARICSPPPLSKTVGWTVDAGSDFPSELRSDIEAFDTSCVLRETPDRLTTRGWNGYGENDARGASEFTSEAHQGTTLTVLLAFRYTTPKLRIDEHNLDKSLLLSRSFHLICSPSRCSSLVRGVHARILQTSAHGQAIMAWEPIPDLCIPSELQDCFDALKVVDVCSPNHVELCGFFDVDPYEANGDIARVAIEHCAQRMAHSGIGRDGDGFVIVRCGKDGCLVANRAQSRWLPAYHATAAKVVDPTGGGNTFLGALTVTLARQDRRERISFEGACDAAIAGSVAASFAIEQVGIPALSQTSDGGELWNGDSVAQRVATFRSAIK